jgi:hypothetical protein
MRPGPVVVVDNKISWQGFRWVHLLRMGGEIDVAEARGKYVTAEAVDVTVARWEEKELGAWHLSLCWPAREVIKLVGEASPAGEEEKNPPLPPLEEKGVREDHLAVMWWTGESLSGEGKASVRESIDLAGTLFKMRVGRDPGRAWVKVLPRGATDKVMVEGVGDVVLEARAWVPGGFVVVV